MTFIVKAVLLSGLGIASNCNITSNAATAEIYFIIAAHWEKSVT